MSKKDKVVAYFYDEECCNHNYGGGNPMRPHRVRLTTSLVKGYDLDQKLILMRPTPQTGEDLTVFHADGTCTHRDAQWGLATACISHAWRSSAVFGVARTYQHVRDGRCHGHTTQSTSTFCNQ